MVLIFTSYFGFIVYLFFGLRFKKRIQLKKHYSRSFLKKTKFMNYLQYHQLIKIERIIKFLEVGANSKLTLNNKLQSYNVGKDFFDALYADLEKATSTIHMEYYIFNDDAFGNKFYNLLIKKSQEGVKILLIVDGAGTRGISRKRISELKNNGIGFKIFFPSYLPFLKIGNLRANYRDHKKLTIIDSEITYTGGYNIGLDYISEGKLGHWEDFGVRVEGASTIEFEKEFIIDWAFLGGNKDDYEPFIHKLTEKEKNIKEISEENMLPIQVFSSAPIYQVQNVRNNIIELIMSARKSICITTPYFIPDEPVFDTLKMAAIAGIDVKVIIPCKPDHLFVYWANQSYVSELIGYGVKFYRYQNGFIHTKMTIVDNEVACVGTANFDYRSFYQNFELNLNIYSHKEILKIRKVFDSILKSSLEIDPEKFKNRKKLEIFKESLCRLFSPIL
jgi:cardiolipin synthase